MLAVEILPNLRSDPGSKDVIGLRYPPGEVAPDPGHLGDSSEGLNSEFEAEFGRVRGFSLGKEVCEPVEDSWALAESDGCLVGVLGLPIFERTCWS